MAAPKEHTDALLKAQLALLEGIANIDKGGEVVAHLAQAYAAITTAGPVSIERSRVSSPARR